MQYFSGYRDNPKQLAQALLVHPGLTVVTNNLNAALTLSRNPNINLYLAGGLVRHSDEDTVGEATTRLNVALILRLEFWCGRAQFSRSIA